jgi:hypothetical protein
MGGDLTLDQSAFQQDVPAFNPSSQSTKRDLQWVQQPLLRQNEQTLKLCQQIGICDPLDEVLGGQWPKVPSLPTMEAERERKDA